MLETLFQGVKRGGPVDKSAWQWWWGRHDWAGYSGGGCRGLAVGCPAAGPQGAHMLTAWAWRAAQGGGARLVPQWRGLGGGRGMALPRRRAAQPRPGSHPVQGGWPVLPCLASGRAPPAPAVDSARGGRGWDSDGGPWGLSLRQWQAARQGPASKAAARRSQAPHARPFSFLLVAPPRRVPRKGAATGRQRPLTLLPPPPQRNKSSDRRGGVRGAGAPRSTSTEDRLRAKVGARVRGGEETRGRRDGGEKKIKKKKCTRGPPPSAPTPRRARGGQPNSALPGAPPTLRARPRTPPCRRPGQARWAGWGGPTAPPHAQTTAGRRLSPRAPPRGRPPRH